MLFYSFMIIIDFKIFNFRKKIKNGTGNFINCSKFPQILTFFFWPTLTLKWYTFHGKCNWSNPIILEAVKYAISKFIENIFPFLFFPFSIMIILNQWCNHESHNKDELSHKLWDSTQQIICTAFIYKQLFLNRKNVYTVWTFGIIWETENSWAADIPYRSIRMFISDFLKY